MPRFFSKCVLHIGTEKTGTTTLQRFLGENRALLAERGYFIPKSLSPYQVLANHERLTTTSLETTKLSDDLRRAARLETQADVIAHRVRVRDEFDQEVRQIETRIPMTLLLSNEHCHSRLISDDEVQTLYEFLSRYADDFEVIVYLRPQHELATSLYDQALKAGYADIDVLPDLGGTKIRWVEQRYFDYDDLTLRWGRVFASNKVRPRIFVREELIGESIIDDFLYAIGCDHKSSTARVEENKSMSSEFQSVLNAVNRYAKTHSEHISPGIRARLIAKLQGLSQGSGRRPTRMEAEEFYKRFVESNERVRQRHFPQRKSLFNPDFSSFPVQLPESPSELDALIRALVMVSAQ